MRRRWPILAVASAAALAALAALALPAAEDRLLYNHTPSVPVGFYLRTDAPLERGSFVTVRAIDVAPAMAAARGFNGPRDRFIKRVAALAGDHICARGDAVTLNGGLSYDHRGYDSTGAALPAWEACRVLGPDEVLILGDTQGIAAAFRDRLLKYDPRFGSQCWLDPRHLKAAQSRINPRQNKAPPSLPDRYQMPSEQAQRPARHHIALIYKEKMVGATGIEPVTPTMST